MNGKFAVLEYADAYQDFITNRAVLAVGSKKLLNWYARRKLAYKTETFNILGVEGLKVTLPITFSEAQQDKRHMDEIYTGVLNLLRQDGVNAVKPIRGTKYTYDDIITAASGFYILPFILPEYIKKCVKASGKQSSGTELLIIDGIADLTVDILCVISNEINHVTVITNETDFFRNIAYRFYCDSGLNINIIDNPGDISVKSADIILNTSHEPDSLANKYNTGVFFLDMVGNEKKVTEILSRRPDIVCADGIEFKKDGQYIDNILLEAVCLSNSAGFSRYVFGGYGDSDFYGFLDYIETLDLKITTLLRSGKSI